jgi:hypothetical protein
LLRLLAMKRKRKAAPTLQDSELLLSELPEPDLSELHRWHDAAFRDRLVDVLTNVPGFADARDPDPAALLNAVNPPSRREH